MSNGRRAQESSDDAWARDPNNLNTHIQIMWDDIIGEPEGLQSLDFTWECSQFCFKGTQACCYILMTVLTAPCFAFCAGMNFACLGFMHIWAAGPCIRMCKINMAVLRKLNSVCMSAICAPFCETTGLLLSKMRLRMNTSEQRERDEDPELVFTS